jgi:putative flippase GtrA
MSQAENTGSGPQIKKSKIKKSFADLVTRNSLAQFGRYAIVGSLSFLFEYSLYFILLQVLHIWFILSNIIVYALIFWFNFIFNRIWSFRSKDDLKKQLLKYTLLFFFNLALTSSVLYLLTDTIGISPLISKVMVMCLIVPWNFLIYKNVIYR